MLVNNSNLTTIWVDANDQQINIIDQRYLPHKLSIVKLNSVKDV
jgi:methylthioribose-1-phosphate isomerase